MAGVHRSQGKHKLSFSLKLAVDRLTERPPTIGDKLDLDPATLDHTVRRKFGHFLDPSYRPFALADLPLELILPILSYATGCSQGTYRSLLLTSKRISDLVRSEEMLSGVSVILSTPWQLESFAGLLKARPEAIPQIHDLWTILPFASKREIRDAVPTTVSVIRLCTNVRSLACTSRVLYDIIHSSAPFEPTQLFEPTQCVDLTLDLDAYSYSLMNTASAAAHPFLRQIHRLHLIGTLESSWGGWGVLPTMDNLTHLSVATGSATHIEKRNLRKVVKSPKLQQAVITTRLTGDEQEFLAGDVHDIDPRFSVLYRRRRWTEPKLWHERAQDPARFWTQASAEKHVFEPGKEKRRRPLEQIYDWGDIDSDSDSNGGMVDWAVQPTNGGWESPDEEGWSNLNVPDTEILDEDSSNQELDWPPLVSVGWNFQPAQAQGAWTTGRTWRTPDS
ncbi:hypothetical protein C8R46DRAFT_1102990 [Mycena filopes]|nr:hypothetical protein C8R46DRAFT_1102990 [Mycena filopes]